MKISDIENQNQKVWIESSKVRAKVQESKFKGFRKMEFLISYNHFFQQCFYLLDDNDSI